MGGADYEYVLFVDEAGDFSTRLRVAGHHGSSEWFAIGGFLTARRDEHQIVDWVRSAREIANARDSADLHYNRLDMQRRIEVAKFISSLPIRTFVVMSHKENMRGHVNKRAARIGGKNVFYNFCLRVLLERVTQGVAIASQRIHGDIRPMRIVIAETGGVRYEQTKRYLDKLRAQAITGSTYLNKSVIHPTVAATWLLENVSAKSVAGCQIADVVVSAFYNSVNEGGAFPYLDKPAKALHPVVGRQKGQRKNVGLTLLPWDQNIPDRFKPAFRSYGFQWRG